MGYHRDEAGANDNAGWLIEKTLPISDSRTFAVALSAEGHKHRTAEEPAARGGRMGASGQAGRHGGAAGRKEAARVGGSTSYAAWAAARVGRRTARRRRCASARPNAKPSSVRRIRRTSISPSSWSSDRHTRTSARRTSSASTTETCRHIDQCFSPADLDAGLIPGWKDTAKPADFIDGCAVPAGFQPGGAEPWTGKRPIARLPNAGGTCCYTFLPGGLLRAPIFVAAVARVARLTRRSDWTAG
jgi:hypothetical protein